MLYFYSESNCPRCVDQGVILSFYKNIYQDQLLIFPIDVSLVDQEPIIAMLEEYYSISEYPSIVLNGEVHQGLVSRDAVGDLIGDDLL
jgi:hypothetical protein